MKPITLLLLAAALCLLAPALAAADALDKLQGKWTLKKARDGQTYSQVIEIKQDKLTFTLLDSSDQVRVFAKGTVKAEKLGPFNVLKFSDIQAGDSADDAKAVDEEFSSIYVPGDGTLTIASNLDKQRENQPPALDVYTRAATPKQSAAATDELAGKLVGKWNMELNLGENARKYELRIAKGKDGLEAVVVSERSGEHKCKTASVKDDELTLELDRDIQGSEVTFVYKGKLADGKLSGTVVIKEHEDQFSGKWTATK